MAVNTSAAAHGGSDTSSVFANLLHWLTAPDHVVVVLGAGVLLSVLLGNKLIAKRAQNRNKNDR